MIFLQTLMAEIVKIKRSSLLVLTFLTAALTPVIILFENLDGIPDRELNKADPLRGFYTEGFQYIAIMFLPLFIVLICTLLIQIEHRNNAWKQVLASPQSFHHILLSKFLVMQGMVIMMLVVFNLLMILVAVVINRVHPELNVLSYLNNFSDVLFPTAKTYVASLGMSAIQFWLALRFRNFIVPLGIGISLWMISPISLFEMRWVDLMNKFPYALSIIVVVKNFQPMHLWVQLLSIAYMFIFLAVAYAELSVRRLRAVS